MNPTKSACLGTCKRSSPNPHEGLRVPTLKVLSNRALAPESRGRALV
jgi:hypothetical protein